MLIETFKRSFFKTVSYRIIGSIVTIIIGYVLTQKIELAVAAGLLDVFFKMILYLAHERLWMRINYGRELQKGYVLWMTGLSGSGKSTLAKKIYDDLKENKSNVVWLDGDNIRKHFPQLGFSYAERIDHNKRVAMSAALLEQQGNIVIVSLISPYKEARYAAREICTNFYEIYLTADLNTCRQRDIKGLYQKADAGLISHFTGITDIYEAPISAELVLDTGQLNAEESFKKLKKFVSKIR